MRKQTDNFVSTADALAALPSVINEEKNMAPSPPLILEATDEELRALTRQKLLQLLQDERVSQGVLLGVCREILDRLDGKPVQRQAVMAQIDDKRGKVGATLEKLSVRELDVLLEALEE